MCKKKNAEYYTLQAQLYDAKQKLREAKQVDIKRHASFTLEKIKSLAELVWRTTPNILSIVGWALLLLLLAGLLVCFICYLVALGNDSPVADSIHAVVQVLSGASSLGVGICGLVMSAKSSEEAATLKQMISNIRIDSSEENVKGVVANNERY